MVIGVRGEREGQVYGRAGGAGLGGKGTDVHAGEEGDRVRVREGGSTVDAQCRQVDGAGHGCVYRRRQRKGVSRHRGVPEISSAFPRLKPRGERGLRRLAPTPPTSYSRGANQLAVHLRVLTRTSVSSNCSTIIAQMLCLDSFSSSL